MSNAIEKDTWNGVQASVEKQLMAFLADGLGSAEKRLADFKAWVKDMDRFAQTLSLRVESSMEDAVEARQIVPPSDDGDDDE